MVELRDTVQPILVPDRTAMDIINQYQTRNLEPSAESDVVKRGDDSANPVNYPLFSMATGDFTEI